MDWKYLKANIYNEDGSLRDIFVLNTTIDDWKKWVDFVNTNYKTSTCFYAGDKTSDGIDFKVMLEYWNGKTDNYSMPKILIKEILVNAYYSDPVEIENDIDPREIKNIDDHDRIINYMMGISNLLQKKVILTPEMEKETVLISVYNSKMEIN